MKILIYGAGSIGNHYANGFVERNHDISITDIDSSALNRMKNEIYPGRYGEWNKSIKLLTTNEIKNIYFDLVFIGTPPISHIDICLNAIDIHKPKIIHIEKPISVPNLSNIKY